MCVLTGITQETDIAKCSEAMAPLFYTDSLADIRDILVFGEDMTNEDEEKQAMAELERLKQERREMRRKQREERKRKKEELDKDIAEGKKMMQEELEKMEKEEKQKELEAIANPIMSKFYQNASGAEAGSDDDDEL